MPPKGVKYPELWEKAKEKVKRDVLKQGGEWPSAYASSRISPLYKKLVGNKYDAFDSSPTRSREIKGIKRWHLEKWIDVCTNKPCGRSTSENRKYPYCRPTKKISSKTPRLASTLSPSQKKKLCSQKQKNPAKRMKNLKRKKPTHKSRSRNRKSRNRSRKR